MLQVRFVIRNSIIFKIPRLLVITSAILCMTPASAGMLSAVHCPQDYIPLFVSSDYGVAEGEAAVEADVAESTADGDVFLGNVIFVKDESFVSADEITLQDGILSAVGSFVFRKSGKLEIRSDMGKLDSEQDRGEIRAARFRLADGPTLTIDGNEVRRVQLRGQAELIVKEPDDRVLITKGHVSKCPAGNNDVVLHAAEIELDPATSQGVAKKVVIRFNGVPIIGLPVLYFALGNERRTGFLYPTLKHTKKHGFGIAVPYYINLAPNYDMTQTVEAMSKGKLRVHNEYRHLGKWSESLVLVEGLVTDGEDDRDVKDLRGAYLVDQHFKRGHSWFGNVNIVGVSDDYYLKDFAGEFGSSSDSYVTRTADAHFLGDTYVLSAGAQRFKVAKAGVNKESATLDRAPWVEMDVSQPIGRGVTFDSNLRFDKFLRQNQSLGTRFVGDNSLSYRWQRPYGDFEIIAGNRTTKFSSLATTVSDTTTDSRSVPFYAIDGSLFFDRPVASSDNGHTWTLQPRIAYIKVPYRDQSHLPEFDTTARFFLRYEDLFAVNRYIGGDRLGDTDHLTFGTQLSLRDDEHVKDVFNLSLGQVFYYNDRQPQIEGEALDNTKKSDGFLGIQATVSDAIVVDSIMRADYRWRDVEQTSVTGRYAATEKTAVTGNYQYEVVQGEQLGLRFDHNMNSTWQIAAQSVRSLEESMQIHSKVLVNYKNCCWSIEFEFGRQLEEDRTRDTYAHIYFRLKGFGGY